MSVFLSYAEEDAPVVHRIFDILDRMRLEPYAYKLFMEAGEILEEVILGRIKLCKVFFPFLTRLGISSQWVNQEIGVARALGKFIVPVIEEALVPEGFVQFRIHIPYSPFNPDQMIYLLLRRVQSLLNPQAMSLKCECGNIIWGKVPPPREIDDLLGQGKVFTWDCPCGRFINVSPLTLEQLPQV